MSLQVAAAVMLGFINGEWAAAQPVPRPAVRETMTLPTDGAAERKLILLADFLEEQQWEQAIELLESVARDHRDALIAVAPGRYVNVGRYCNSQLANLPPAGLTRYRMRIDPQARRWWDAAQAYRDERLLHRILQLSYASSYGDDALLVLGDRAWERGKFNLARRYWRQLLPLEGAGEEQPVADVLSYPDSHIPREQILARLLLVEMLQRDRNTWTSKLEWFREAFPAAEGTLAGETGLFAEILAGIADSDPQLPPTAADCSTFAGNLARNSIVHELDQAVQPIWSAELPALRFEPLRDNPAMRDDRPLSFFPTVVGDVLLLHDAHRVWAYNVQSGLPFWQVESGPADAVIYSEARAFAPVTPIQPTVGVPRFTSTVDNGCLYVRMGPPIISRSDDELRALESELICLDLARRQGQLKWKLSAGELPGRWAFSGTPVAADGRIYVALRGGRPKSQFSVACLDAQTGTLLWNQAVGAAVAGVDDRFNLVGHELLTLGAGFVFYATDAGALAALDAHTGQLEWVATYPSQRPSRNAELSDARQMGLLPCVFHCDTVYAAPSDSNYVIAIDAATGVVKWARPLPKERVRHLLGVSRGGLYVSGDRLWALDTETGEPLPAWREQGPVGFADPSGYGFGRGLLTRDHIYWPTREEIFVIDQVSRRIVRRIPLRERFGMMGGNLVAADGRIVIAGRNRITVLGMGPPLESGDRRPLVSQNRP